jgi:hypothetical protein
VCEHERKDERERERERERGKWKEPRNGLSLVEIKERGNKYNWTTLESPTRRNLLRVPQTSMAAIQKYFWTKSPARIASREKEKTE